MRGAEKQGRVGTLESYFTSRFAAASGVFFLRNSAQATGGGGFFLLRPMTKSNSLAIFTKAALMLAEANTIQKAKELKDMALTAADWAKRKGMGEEAIQHCRSYALEAERKMGEMLKATERNKGAKGNPGGRGAAIVYLPGVSTQPTIADLGLKFHESARAQALADLPAKDFEAIKDGTKTRAQVVRETVRVQVRKSLDAEATINVPPPDRLYDVVIIDPPWPMGKWELN